MIRLVFRGQLGWPHALAGLILAVLGLVWWLAGLASYRQQGQQQLVLLDSVLQARERQDRRRYDSIAGAVRHDLYTQQQRSQELQRRDQDLEAQYRRARVVLPEL